MVVSILIFILVLSILVLVHEAGHFFMARRAGVWVEEFGFGLPPRVWGKKYGKTLYSLNLLPFGGFVRLHGENTEEGVTKPKEAFLSKSKLSRSKIVLAGVVMNFVLAMIAFAIVYSFTGVPIETGNVEVVEVAENSPAHQAGIQKGDTLRLMDGKEISTSKDFIEMTDGLVGQTVELEFERGPVHESIMTSLTPRENPPEGEGAIGVVISSTEVYFPPIWQRPFYGIYYGTRDALFMGYLVVQGMLALFAGLLTGQIPQGIAGPVGIYALTTEAASLGVLTLINFIGVLSVNLAVLNLFPFPALDGGRFLFILLEAVMGRKVLPKAEMIIHAVGIVILIGLLLLITVSDIGKLISFGGVSGYLDNLLQ